MKSFFLTLVPRRARIIFIARVSWWSLSSSCTCTPRLRAAISRLATGIRSKEYSAIRMVAPFLVWSIARTTWRSILSRTSQPPRGLLKNAPVGTW